MSCKEELGAVSPMHSAALAGDRATIKKLGRSPQQLEARDELGRTPLIYSAMGDQLECALALLRLGARVDNPDNSGQTALHWAAHKGLHRLVSVLLASDALWSQKDVDGVTALHLAARQPQAKCLATMLKEVASGQVDVQDCLLRTPLHWASKEGNVEHIRLLISQGANIQVPDSEGKIPLHYAATCSVQACTALILSESALILNWQDYEGQSPLHLAVAAGNTEVVDHLTSKSKCDLNSTDNVFRTPLHWAALLGHKEIVGILLDRGADHKCMDGNGARPLHYATQSQSTETVATFLTRSYISDEPDAKGAPAILWAAASGASAILQVLVKLGVDINLKDSCGNTALHVAACHGHTEAIATLLELGGDPDLGNQAGLTPLLQACKLGRARAIPSLLGHGATALDCDLRNGLHWSSIQGNAYVCQVLILKGLQFNAKDAFGRTPLHYASYFGHTNCASVLLDHNAHEDQPDNTGWTPLFWACSQGHLDIAKILCQHGAFVNTLAVSHTSFQKFLFSEAWLTPLDVSQQFQEVWDYLRLQQDALTAREVQTIAADVIKAAWRRHRAHQLGKHSSISRRLPISKIPVAVWRQPTLRLLSRETAAVILQRACRRWLMKVRFEKMRIKSLKFLANAPQWQARLATLTIQASDNQHEWHTVI